MAAHSSIPAWRIPWTAEPGGLLFKGSQRAGPDLVTKRAMLGPDKLLNPFCFNFFTYTMNEVPVPFSWACPQGKGHIPWQALAPGPGPGLRGGPARGPRMEDSAPPGPR